MPEFSNNPNILSPKLDSGFKFPVFSKSEVPTEAFLPKADQKSVEVFILNASIGRLFLLTDRLELPNAEQLEQIKLRFSVFAELFSAGAPVGLVVEGICHPIFADRDRYTQEVGVMWANQCIERFSKLGLVQLDAVSGVPSDLSSGNRCPTGQLARFKSQLVSAILGKIPAKERVARRYSAQEVDSIVSALGLSIEIIMSDSRLKQANQVWPLLQHVVEVGCLLLSVECSAETVIGGLFHHVRDMIPCAESFARRFDQILRIYGQHVVDIIDSLKEVINPTHDPVAKLPGAPIFGPPLSVMNLEGLPDSFKNELIVINSASVMSHLFYRINQVSMPLGAEVISEEAASYELWEFGAFYEVLLRDEVPKPFLLLYQDRLRIFVNRIREMSSRTAELSVSHRVLSLLINEFDFIESESGQALGQLAYFFEVAYSLNAQGIPRRFVEEGMLHPDLCLCDDGVRMRIMEIADAMSTRLRHSFNVVFSCCNDVDSFSKEKIAKNSHHRRLPPQTSELQRQNFKDHLVTSILHRVPKEELWPPYMSRDALALVDRALGRARQLVLEAELEHLPRPRVRTFMHLLEVGFLLTRGNVHVDVVIAGILHDVYEFFSESKLAAVRDQVRVEFGKRVDRLIHAVTERRQNTEVSGDGFCDKKTSVIRALEGLQIDEPELAAEASAILCASKICTMSEGLTYFKKYGTTRGWSKGSYTSNLIGMCANHDLFMRLNTPSRMLQLYQSTLEEWMTAGVNWTLGKDSH